MPIFWGEVSALTSDLAYPRHCFRSHSVLGEGVSYAYDLGKVGRVIKKFQVPELVENYLGWWAIILSAWLRGTDELYP